MSLFILESVQWYTCVTRLGASAHLLKALFAAFLVQVSVLLTFLARFMQPCCHKFAEADSVSMQQILQLRFQLLSNPTWEGEGPLGPLE